jgi:hypothetical protein
VYIPLFQDHEFSGMHVFAGQQIETDDDENDFANYLDGPRLQAKLDNPRCVVENGRGDLFFCEALIRRIRKISSEGIVSTFVGGGEIGRAVRRDGSGADARLSDGGPMAIGSDGLLYFIDYKFLRSVTPMGVVRTLNDQMEHTIAICSGPANDLFFTRSAPNARGRGRVQTELCRYGLRRSSIDVVFRPEVGEALGGVVVYGGQIFVAGDGRIYAVEPTSGEVTLVVDGLDRYFEDATSMDADEDGNLYLGGRWPVRIDVSTKEVTNVARFADEKLGGNADVHIKRHAPCKGHLLVATRHVIFVTDHPVHPWNPEHFEDFN